MFTDTSAPRHPPAIALDSPASDRKGVLRGLIALLLSSLWMRFRRVLFVAGLTKVLGYGLFAALILIGLRYPLGAAVLAIPMGFFSYTLQRLLVFRRIG